MSMYHCKKCQKIEAYYVQQDKVHFICPDCGSDTIVPDNEYHQCSGIAYSEPKDIFGKRMRGQKTDWPCLYKGTIVENGHWWCKRHAPSEVSKRYKKNKEKQRARQREKIAIAPKSISMSEIRAALEERYIEHINRLENDLSGLRAENVELKRQRHWLAAELSARDTGNGGKHYSVEQYIEWAEV